MHHQRDHSGDPLRSRGRRLRGRSPLVNLAVFGNRGDAVIGGEGERITGTGFDTIAAEDAFCDIDIEFTGVALERSRRILGADHFDAMRGTGGFAKIAADAPFPPLMNRTEVTASVHIPAITRHDKPPHGYARDSPLTTCPSLSITKNGVTSR